MGRVQKTSGYEYNAPYRTILSASGSISGSKPAGVYVAGYGGEMATGGLIPVAMVYIADADFPEIRAEAPKLRIRAQIRVGNGTLGNDFIVGLYPVVSFDGSLGAVISGSSVPFIAPQSGAILSAVGADFPLPPDGFYVIGVSVPAPVPSSGLVVINAHIQHHNE